ncbi:PH and SEC7 domain-containing protein 1-like isoform X2 [Scleropages formosus]|uniref:PH and SEC7 domain-containing protein 1-like n=1 Tax=Scleropages formosus TaxID=113540 RepID=A0A8C9RUK0_SCLFO|nr:PH and SEC7 domain-containing protein 1-like isoform X2 [Scleropages formosus]
MEEEQTCPLEPALWGSGAQLPPGVWAYMGESTAIEPQLPGEDDEKKGELGALEPLDSGDYIETDSLALPTVSFSTGTELCPEPADPLERLQSEMPDSLNSSEEDSPDLEWTDNPLSVGLNQREGDAGHETSSLDQRSDSSQEYELSSSDREESDTQIQEEEISTPRLQEETEEGETSLHDSERCQEALRWTANGDAQGETVDHKADCSENIVSDGSQFQFRTLDIPEPTEWTLWNGLQMSACVVDSEAAVDESDSVQTGNGGDATAPVETSSQRRGSFTVEQEGEKWEESENVASPPETDEEEGDEQREEKHSDDSAQSQEQRDQQTASTVGEENENVEATELTNWPDQSADFAQPEELDLKEQVRRLEPKGRAEEPLSEEGAEQQQAADGTELMRREQPEHEDEPSHAELPEHGEQCGPREEMPEPTAQLAETSQQAHPKCQSEPREPLEEPSQPEELQQMCQVEHAEGSSWGQQDGPETAGQVNETVQTEDMRQAENQGEPTESSATQANGGLVDREGARRLAERLYRLDDVRRTDVVKHMDKDNDFSRAVGEEYLKFFDFSGQNLDQSLRSFLKVVVLIGETQERERVLEHFAHRFHQCNPDSFSSHGAVLTLTCAVMLLNTDLHGQNVGKAMTVSSFVSNLDGMNEGENFCKDMLKNLYNSIKNEPLEWAIDKEELKSSLVLPGEEKAEVAPRSKSNPFQDVPHDKRATVFKQGFLTRKAHADVDGKRTPWGKRSWKTFYAVLKGMVLYLQKDEYRMEWQCSEEVVSVHHALAEKAGDYTKKPHVFRLQTADWRVFLFQASTAEQMSSWICRINLVAALYSSPPFPAAVGSQRKFSRPILPATQSTLSMDKQLESHSHMLESFSQDLAELLEKAPEGRKAKARELEEHRLREEYLQHEKSRYEIYRHMLEKWKGLAGGGGAPVSTAQLDIFDSQVCVETGEEDEEDGAGLKKSHSSPSLNLELASAPVVKVKRNISERRTYRKIIIPRRNREL